MRRNNFELGRAIHPTLGGLFQNQMDISMAHILTEMREVYEVERQLAEYKRRVLSCAED